MRSLLAIVPLLFSLPLSVSASQSPLITDDLKVPGENTLTYCKDPADYIFNIDYVNLTPNPPVPGQNLTIIAAGTSSQTIQSEAKLFVQVKLGYVTILRKEYDFCDAIDAVDLSCPLEKGQHKISKVVQIPAAVPPGTYSVSANAWTKDHEGEMTCLQGGITF